MSSSEVRLTTTGTSGNWHGALRSGRVTLAACGHTHRNRDSGHAAARHCAQILVRAARNPEVAEGWIADCVRAAATARGLGARITDDEARTKAEAAITTWRAAVLDSELHLPRPYGAPAWATCGCCPAPMPAEEAAFLTRTSRHRAPWA